MHPSTKQPWHAALIHSPQKPSRNSGALRREGPNGSRPILATVGAMPSPFTEVEVDNRVVKVTNPDRVYFPAHAGRSGATKLDLVEYYLSVGPGIVNALF